MLTFLIKRYNHALYVYKPLTKGFIVIHSIDSAGHLVTVEVLNNRRSASERKSSVHQILFTILMLKVLFHVRYKELYRDC